MVTEKCARSIDVALDVDADDRRPMPMPMPMLDATMAVIGGCGIHTWNNE